MDYPEDNAQEYSDQEESQDNYVDEQREAWEDMTGNTYPAAKRDNNLFTLFKDVWRTNDSSKVSNLDKVEIGGVDISVRDCQEIALFCEAMHHGRLAKYYAEKGEITLATAMSKKGWFVELFVTSKKFAHKGTMQNLVNQGQKQGWRLFGKKETTPQTE